MGSLQSWILILCGALLASALVVHCSAETISPIVIGKGTFFWLRVIPNYWQELALNDHFWSHHCLNTKRVNHNAVPGILGNQLEGKLNKTTVPHFLCTKHTDDYITLWLAISDLLPDGEVDCLSDNLRFVAI